MNRFKKILFHKDLSDIFLLASFVLAVASFILYLTTGVNEFAVSLSPVLIACLVVSLVLELVLLLVGFKAGKYISYLVLLYAFLYYIYTQITYIANVIASIDGNSLSVSFILTIACLLLGSVSALVSGILAKDEKVMLKELKNEME